MAQPPPAVRARAANEICGPQAPSPASEALWFFDFVAQALLPVLLGQDSAPAVRHSLVRSQARAPAVHDFLDYLGLYRPRAAVPHEPFGI